MVFGIASILKWVTDPRNRTVILFIFIALLVGLFFYQRSRTQKFKALHQEQILETKRISNNWKASRDSLIMYMDRDSILTAEISGYQLTVDELKNEYNELFDLYRVEKNKPPRVIIQYKPVLVEPINDIPTEVQGDSIISFIDSADYGDGNLRVIEAQIPFNLIYRIKKDSVNNYAFDRALRYAHKLNERNDIEDAFVVIYQNDKRITYEEIQNSDSLIFHVQIFTSEQEFSEREIANRFNLDKDYIFRKYEDGIFKYMTGAFIPRKNVEPIVSADELLTYAQLQTGLADARLKLSLNLGTALYKDPETQEIKIQVKSNYPGLIFQDVRGAEIMTTLKSDKKLARSFRKEWGIGFQLGVGVYPAAVNDQFKLKVSPFIGVGINYTPRWLQFGPDKVGGKNTLNKLLDGE